MGTSYLENRAKQKFMKKNELYKLNYVCMEDIEKPEVRADGRKILSNPNSFINIAEMRANQFKLQHFFNDILPLVEAPKDDPEQQQDRQIEVIMTRQKKLWPQQMQSLIIASGDRLRVSQFFVD